MADNRERSVGGYLFYTEKDAKIAEAELQKIEYLEARILKVYEKTIHERIFRTPVGLQYLKGLRDFLLEQPEIDPEDVTDIPLYSTFGGQLRSQDNPARSRIKPSREKAEKEKSFLVLSLILNGLLILAVIAMFSIALKSNNPNILNYEKAITNKYAAWEQELTEREQRIREKEKELRIEESRTEEN